MLAYRISRTPFIKDLSGSGAYTFGGRWNSKGVRVLYLAESASLALLEVLVHISNFEVESSFSLLTLQLPEIEVQQRFDLPVHWRKTPPPFELQQIGNEFIANGSSLYARVPSVVMPVDENILVNPGHSDFEKVKIISCDQISIEGRLFRVGTTL